jgi:hypothetical protein
MSNLSENTIRPESAEWQDGNGHPNSFSNEKPLMDRALPGINTPYLAQKKKIWMKMIITFIVLLVVIVMGILSLYWGADHSLQFNMPVFTAAIIDFDKEKLGHICKCWGLRRE